MKNLGLEEILKDEPPYRLVQVEKLIYRDLVEDWDEASTLPKSLRAKLKSELPLEIKAETLRSQDRRTLKAVLSLSDGLLVETVLMMSPKNRNSVCVSSQVGCPLNCLFCATGKMGYYRNLTVAEIVNQVLFFERLLKKIGAKVTHVVFMGMGEPFLNFDNVLSSVKILNNKEMLNLGIRKISISTVGIPSAINRLRDEKIDVNLAVSLHAPNDNLRSSLIPINRVHPIKKVLEAVDSYITARKRRVMFEYILINGVNDSPKEATELALLLKHQLYHLNLIPYNPTGIFKASSLERIKGFKKILVEKKVPFTQRFRFGSDIKAACGQLASKEPHSIK